MDAVKASPRAAVVHHREEKRTPETEDESQLEKPLPLPNGEGRIAGALFAHLLPESPHRRTRGRETRVAAFSLEMVVAVATLSTVVRSSPEEEMETCLDTIASPPLLVTELCFANHRSCFAYPYRSRT
nr:hypothetical protein Iba_chr11bCG13220 [Ipomoea batatas]